jgi:hypothetical protein
MLAMQKLLQYKAHPRRRAHTQEATLALWGAEKVGKSAYLAALERASTAENLTLVALDKLSAETMQALRTSRADHRFPAPTSVPDPNSLPLLRFALEGARHRDPITLNIADAAGSWWTHAEDAAGFTPRAPFPTEPSTLLERCHGILCFLDPTAALKSPHTPELARGTTNEPPPALCLQSMLAQLRYGTYANRAGVDSRPVKIAICLTQMDRPEHYAHLGREAAYFRRLYGSLPLHNWITKDNLRFFGCSSVGMIHRARYTVSNTFIDREGQARIIDPTMAPLHLFRPIKWLLGLD